jgi:hypothetical protein
MKDKQNNREEIILELSNTETQIRQIEDEALVLAKDAAKRSGLNVSLLFTTENIVQIKQKLEQVKKLELKRDQLWDQLLKNK